MDIFGFVNTFCKKNFHFFLILLYLYQVRILYHIQRESAIFIMKRNRFHRTAVALFALVLLVGSGCDRQSSETSADLTEKPEYIPGKTNVLTPEFGQENTTEAGPLKLDFSHANQGYFMGVLSEEGEKINLQVTGPDGIEYKYFLEEANVDTAFPFTAGSGDYIILGYQNIGGDQYASLLSSAVTVELENDFLPFLYPNQYVDFTQDSEAVRLAGELSADCESDLDALTAIYSYVTEHVIYDDLKAATVETGYLPDIDETLETGKGICFDYAALTASMLRALSIPARLNIGYSGDVRHAWVDVYIESVGWVRKAVQFNGNEWEMMDPTFAAALGDDELTNDYVGDGENYSLQYIR